MGSCFGSIFSAPLLALGKRKVFLICNLLVIAGSVCGALGDGSLVYLLYIGRVLFGFASGVLSVIVPQFINETAPNELKGPLGALHQFMVTTGILVPGIMALALPLFTFDSIT